MKCPICGTEVPITVNVCPTCGRIMEVAEPKDNNAFSIDDVFDFNPAELSPSEILRRENHSQNINERVPQPSVQMNNASHPQGYGMRSDVPQQSYAMSQPMQQPNPSMRFSPPIQNVNTQRIPTTNIPKQKKKSPVLGIVIATIVLIFIIAVGASGGKNKTTTDASEVTAKADKNSEATKSETKEEEKKQEVFNIGETWTVDGQWSLTVLGAKKTEDRNQYSDKTPAAVYLVDYSYTNLGYEEEYSDGLFISMEDTIVDNAGKMGYSYPGDKTNYAQETPIGATCTAQACIGVDNDGIFKITVSDYDNNHKKHSATFIIDPSKEATNFEAPSDAATDMPALAIGETWTVDGQWKLTITGVSETEDRNQYSDKTPEAVYLVDYTYENLGYEDEYSDGLFISLEDTIVDNTGAMGYSYPGDKTKYAQETPVGATCEAQACIGVDNAGDFKITVSTYDGNKKRQSETFIIKVD